MISRLSAGLFLAAACICLYSTTKAQSALQIVQATPAQSWQRLEFNLTNVPASSNPFDPDVIRLDATFILPSSKTVTVPAFWYQDYQRSLSGGYENDTPVGLPGWRLRFTPTESGSYTVSITIQTRPALRPASQH